MALIRRTDRKMLKAIGLILAGVLLCGCQTENVQETAVKEEVNDMEQTTDTLEFFQSLDYDNGLDTAVRIFRRFPLQYGTTLGLDGNPQIRPLEFKFEEDGVLYFDTVEFYTSYKEMQAHPYLQICICDQQTMTYLRLAGTVNFTKDQDIIDRCFENSPVLTSQFGDHRDVVVGYYLTDVWAEFQTFSPELKNHTWKLKNKFDQ